MGGILDKLDDWLIDGWRRCWKLMTVWYTAISALLLVVLQLGPILPDQVRAAIPQPWSSIGTLVWFLIWLAMRVKQQKPSA